MARYINQKFATEAALRESVESLLAPSFRIFPEVWGTHCSGKRLRIDAILSPIEQGQWFDPAPLLGVEFKGPRNSTHDFTRWCAQAVSYTHVKWDGFGRVPVFACPSPFTEFSGSSELGLMKRVMGQLGIGELTELSYHGWTFLLNGSRVWSVETGISAGARWSLSPRIGC